MIREEALATLRTGLSLLPHGEARAAALSAFNKLIADLESAEGLLDQGYDEIVLDLPDELKPELDRIVFSRRSAKSE